MSKCGSLSNSSTFAFVELLTSGVFVAITSGICRFGECWKDEFDQQAHRRFLGEHDHAEFTYVGIIVTLLTPCLLHNPAAQKFASPSVHQGGPRGYLRGKVCLSVWQFVWLLPHLSALFLRSSCVVSALSCLFLQTTSSNISFHLIYSPSSSLVVVLALSNSIMSCFSKIADTLCCNSSSASFIA